MTSYDEVVSQLAEYNSCDRELAQKNLRRSIITQEEIPSTKRLIEQLKEAGYRLYVLSNMSLEFIEFLHTKDVYNNFEGEVVSCYEHVVKPDVKIYKILTERYGLDQAETLFIDDRAKNVDTAIMLPSSRQRSKSGRNSMKKTSQRSLLFRQNVNRTESENIFSDLN